MIPAHTKTTVYVSASSTAPELGMQTLPPMEGNSVLAVKGWEEKPGEFDITNVDMITFWMMNNIETCEFVFDNVRLTEDPNQNYKESYKGMLDAYGQYTKQEWPDKIKSDEQLIQAEQEENISLDKMLAENKEAGERTIYGGYKNEAFKKEAKGYFYTAKIDDKWTLIDPLGYPYFATGVDILRTQDMNTWVTGREFMFEALPDKTKGFEEHYSAVGGTNNPPFKQETGEAVNFYTANLEKKYGDDWKETWANQAIKRFKAWGMTSIGCWADPQLFYGKDTGHEMTYTAHAWSHEGGSFNKLFSGSPDAFDPAFEKAVNKAIETTANQGTKDDPFCMGIYVDNEIHWGDATSNVDPYQVVYAAFKQEKSTSPAKAQFITMMKEKYGTIEALNNAWGSTLESFEALDASYTGPIAQQDKSDMLFAIADKYYQTVAAAVDKHMPNTLYLGSRIANWGTGNEVIDAAAKYVDVMSFNCYKTDINQEWMDFDRYDKPIIIGEFHFTATDEGFFAPGLVPVGEVANRGKAYEKYMQSALNHEDFVGIHWFQYYDQPVLGRAWDGENTNTGFVDVTDTPYPDLVESARKMNQSMYDIKFADNSANKEGAITEKVEATFPMISFEEGEKVNYTVQGANCSSKVVTDKGVSEGTQALEVSMNKRSKDWSTISKLVLHTEESWDMGTEKKMQVTVTNPNEVQIQLRMNLVDKLGNVRTLYYGIPAGATQELIIGSDEFGTPGVETQKWEGNGFFSKGVDSSQITSIEFYMPEPDDAVMGTIESASFIVDGVMPIVE